MDQEQTEAKHCEVTKEVKTFRKTSLRKTDTTEKSHMPTQEGMCFMWLVISVSDNI